MNRTFETLLPLLQTDETPKLGPARRSPALNLEALRAQIESLSAAAGLSGTAAELVRSLVLLWHDQLDESHTISQGVDSSDGSFVHGIMHRREPDFGNAAYWFRRVGGHPVYPSLAREVASLPDPTPCRERLIAGDRWNPLAMIDACEAVEVGAADPGDEEFLRRVQGLEFRLLLERFAAL
jgi:hypothetical protein